MIDSGPEPDFSQYVEDKADEIRNEESKPGKSNGAAPKIRSVGDVPSIFTYASQKIDYIVEGMMAAGTVNAFTGESGSGKSTVISAMASAIERGEPFAGMATSRRPVLILDRENPLQVVTYRFSEILAGIRDSENFRIWGGWCSEEPPDAAASMIMTWVASTTPKPVIFVDSLVAFHKGNENDAGETRAHMDGYRRLADMGATVGVLHHSGKGDTTRDYRGSTDFKASIDVGYTVTNIGDPSRIESLRLKSFKARFTVTPEILLRLRNGEFHSDIQTDPGQTNVEILIQLLIENPRVTVTEFARLAATKQVANHRARSFLKSGILERTIDVETGDNNAKYHSWLGCPKGA